jgi:predicted signal transduction protein with EAL and GGDEF domain
MQILFVVAFGLNHAGRYPAAAGLLIASSVLGTWFAIALNLALQSIDAITLSYVLIPVLLCSILLPTQVTVFLAASELAALIVIALLNPVMINPTWEGLVVLVLFISVLSVVAHFISRKDLEQIDRQTPELQESQAHLRELSVRDPLTGLFNRRYLEETLERELGRAARNKLPLGIVMLA